MNLIDIFEALKNSNKKMVGYHSSSKRFNDFDFSKLDSGTGDGGMWGPGFYFTEAPRMSKSFGGIHGYIYKCELNFDNPFICNSEDSREELRNLIKADYTDNKNSWDMENFFKAGYDSIISRYEPWSNFKKKSMHNQYVAFKPEQIKILKVSKY